MPSLRKHLRQLAPDQADHPPDAVINNQWIKVIALVPTLRLIVVVGQMRNMSKRSSCVLCPLNMPSTCRLGPPSPSSRQPRFSMKNSRPPAPMLSDMVCSCSEGWEMRREFSDYKYRVNTLE